jgi:hypothetical protein
MKGIGWGAGIWRGCPFWSFLVSKTVLKSENLIVFR